MLQCILHGYLIPVFYMQLIHVGIIRARVSRLGNLGRVGIFDCNGAILNHNEADWMASLDHNVGRDLLG